MSRIYCSATLTMALIKNVPIHRSVDSAYLRARSTTTDGCTWRIIFEGSAAPYFEAATYENNSLNVLLDIVIDSRKPDLGLPLEGYSPSTVDSVAKLLRRVILDAQN